MSERSALLSTVSVILPTYNEAKTIERCLRSILSQDTQGFVLEVLAVDGISTDGTREILDRYAADDSRLRVVQNRKQRTPFAFNLGLQEAKGDFVCILGAHTFYRADYIASCLCELIRQEAAGCGGRVITVPATNSLQSRLAAWAMSHPFGASRSSFRTQREGYVDTVNYAVMRRQLLLDAGGYDETLTRNQDNDMNERLRNRGYKLYCTWNTECLYSPKATLRLLLGYLQLTGYWNVISLRKNPASMSARHFIPFLFVLSVMGALLLAGFGTYLPYSQRLLLCIPLFVVLGLHLGLGSMAGIQVALREKSIGALLLPMVFLGIHLAYGYGTLCGFLGSARARSTVFTVH